jgi:chorismate dehydratase
MYTVGSVPYLNARPLVRYFHEPGCRRPVRVLYDVPSKLPALIESGEAAAVLASSIESLNVPGRSYAEGLCIASHGPVLSVRLFSKCAPGQIRSVAFDQSSLTSNALARIVLAERYGVRPAGTHEPPNLERMLAKHDACILIGDIGMRTEGAGLHILDLGEEWTLLTGLPFVWALWIGGEELTPELSGMLLAARVMSCLGAESPSSQNSKKRDLEKRLIGPFSTGEAAEVRRTAEIHAIASETGWTAEQVRRYLSQTIIFDLGDRELEGLRAFQRLLVMQGHPDALHFPREIPAETQSIEFAGSL